MEKRFLKNMLIIFMSQILYSSICSINSFNSNPGESWIVQARNNFPFMRRLNKPAHLYVAVYLTNDIQSRYLKLKRKNGDFLHDILAHFQRLMEPYGFDVRYVHFEDWGHYPRSYYWSASDFNPLIRYIQDKDEDIHIHIFLANVRWGRRIGVASMDTLCSKRAVLVLDLLNYYHKETQFAAVVLQHEVGHILGFEHFDPTTSCPCVGECVMMPSINNRGQNETISTFSPCEIGKIESSYDSKTCVHEPYNGIQYFLKCGNSVVDEGEQCECSLFESTYRLPNTDCCNCSSCQFLREDYQCSDGPCCYDCMFTTGNICRQAFSECDIPDRCNGYSSDCPIDVIHPDNKLCNYGQGFCQKGMCMSMMDVCRFTFKEPHAYFIRHCIEKVENLLGLYCQYSLTYRDHVCEPTMDTCRWLVCSSRGVFLPNSNQISYGGFPLCYIPSPQLETSMPHAPNYMQCSSSDPEKVKKNLKSFATTVNV